METKTPKTKLMLVEDHLITLVGLRTLLKKEKGLKIISEATRGEEALLAMKSEKPDLIITDLSMPGMDGFELIDRIIREDADAKILVVSMHFDRSCVKKAISAGAIGYVSKNAPVMELINAVYSVIEGKTYFSSEISDVIMQDYISNVRGDIVSVANIKGELTKREKEILTLIVDGNNSTQIAKKLMISNRTVQNHKARMMRKLNVKSTVQLVKYVLKHGLSVN